MTRRCGWLPAGRAARAHVVWARQGIGVENCPKSLITAESIGWLEAFAVWKRLGRTEAADLTARDAEAFLILEEQLAQERPAGEASRR